MKLELKKSSNTPLEVKEEITRKEKSKITFGIKGNQLLIL